MQHVTSYDILSECKRFKQNIIQHAGAAPFNELMRKLMSKEVTSSIFSMSSILPKLKEIPKEQDALIQEASSGKTSEIHIDTDNPESTYEFVKTERMSYGYIETLLIDETSFEEIAPGSQGPVVRSILALVGIDKTVNYFRLHNFVNALQFVPQFRRVRFCFFKGRYTVILHFSKEHESLKFHSCCERKMANFIKTFGDKFELTFLKNTQLPEKKIDLESDALNTKQFISRVIANDTQRDGVRFYNPDFVGVVVRDIPESYSAKDIVENLKKIKLNAELAQSIVFRDHNFCLIKLDTIEAAENACVFLNQRPICNKKLKCHIHSKSNFDRNARDCKNFKSLFRPESIDIDKSKEVLANLETIGRKRGVSWSGSEKSGRKNFRSNRSDTRRTRRIADDNSSQSDRSSSSLSQNSDSYDRKRRPVDRRPYHHDNSRFDRYSHRPDATHWNENRHRTQYGPRPEYRRPWHEQNEMPPRPPHHQYTNQNPRDNPRNNDPKNKNSDISNHDERSRQYNQYKKPNYHEYERNRK